MHFPTSLKFDRLVQYESMKARNCENPLPVKSKMANRDQVGYILIALTPRWLVCKKPIFNLFSLIAPAVVGPLTPSKKSINQLTGSPQRVFQ